MSADRRLYLISFVNGGFFVSTMVRTSQSWVYPCWKRAWWPNIASLSLSPTWSRPDKRRMVAVVRITRNGGRWFDLLLLIGTKHCCLRKTCSLNSWESAMVSVLSVLQVSLTTGIIWKGREAIHPQVLREKFRERYWLYGEEFVCLNFSYILPTTDKIPSHIYHPTEYYEKGFQALDVPFDK